MEFECGLCGRYFSKSSSLGQHISREHNEGICLPGFDFSFDPDYICGLTNAPGEENCDLDHPTRKRTRSNEDFEEGSSCDDAPGTDNTSIYEEMELKYASFDDDDEDEDADDINIDINVNDNDDGINDIHIDINMNDDEDAIEPEDQAAVIGPDIFQKLMDDYYAQKATKMEIPIEMKAAIDLLSMLRQSNASFSLYNKIVAWMEHYYIEKKDVGKPPSWEAVNNFLEQCYCLECLRPHKFKCWLPTNN